MCESNMKALTRLDLDLQISNSKCSNPDCKKQHERPDQCWFQCSSCGAGDQFEIVYYRKTGTLGYNCSVCHVGHLIQIAS